MIKNIYVFRDVIAGTYDYFGTFVNDAVASREFKRACEAENVPANDLELYNASEFDTDTGRIKWISKSGDPVFVLKGGKNVEN